MALIVNDADKIINKYKVPDALDKRALNADRAMNIWNKTLNGDYRRKEHSWTVATRPTIIGQTVTFTIAPASTVNLVSHPFVDNDLVSFTTTDTLPDTLNSGQVYFVVSAAADTFRVALIQGGVPLNFGTIGSGTHQVYRGLPLELGEIGINIDFNGLEYYTSLGWLVVTGVWTVATRPPTVNLSPNSGGYNTEIGQREYWDGSSWRAV